MNKALKGELWEIEGILYLILATQVPWWFFRSTLIFIGLASIIWGVMYQYQAHTEEVQK